MFDTAVLKARLMALSKAGKFNKKLVNTLVFPTRVTSQRAPEKAKAIEEALEALFAEVKDAAQVCGVDLNEAGGTFIWNATGEGLYQPGVGALGEDVAISWGRSIITLKQLAEQGRKFSLRELVAGKQYALDVFYEQNSYSIDFWVRKGKVVDKAKLKTALDRGTLHQFVDAVKVYSEPLVGLANYKGELHIKTLVTNTPGQYGITGTIWFHELPKYAFAANKKLVMAILTGLDEPVGTFNYEQGELQFVVKGLNSKPINGKQTEWLEWSIIDNSLDTDDFFYEDGGLGAGEGNDFDSDADDEFTYDVADTPY